MVSLVNFRRVSELTSGENEHEQQQQQQQLHETINNVVDDDKLYSTKISISSSQQTKDLLDNNIPKINNNNKYHFKQQQPIQVNLTISDNKLSSSNNNLQHHQNYLAANNNQQQQQQQQQININQSPFHQENNNLINYNNNNNNKSFKKNNSFTISENIDKPIKQSKDHFEIRWSNLTYQVEPKWYKQKWDLITGGGNGSSNSIMRKSSSSSSTTSTNDLNDSKFVSNNNNNINSKKIPKIRIENNNNHNNNNNNKNNKTTVILNELNGSVKSGQVTAILGPSGAGKTSLLGCLTGKKKSGVSGSVKIISQRNEPMSVCTIPQKDYLLNQLTVRENLWFASRLKHPEDNFDHDSNIERVLELLKLESCIDTKISKISGGQYKRVSIAQELLSNPDILILDEPTSGLDSLTCFKTISMLRDLVELSASNDFMKPMAIIVTIHQPQPKVFNLFHHVYILANGARVIYEGAPELSLETITSVTGLQPIEMSQTTTTTTTTTTTGSNTTGQAATLAAQANVDPASFLIEIASGEYGIEPIKTLNDYQRKVFYELNTANGTTTRTRTSGTINNNFMCQNNDLNNHHSMDNQAFSPDYDDNLSAKTNNNTKGINGTLATVVFVDPSKQQQQQQQNLDGAISEEVCETNTSPTNINNNNNNSRKKVFSNNKAIKRRKKSTYSVESGISSRSEDTCHSNVSTISTSSTSSISSSTLNDSTTTNNNDNNSLYMSEQLLSTREANHKGRFWSHTATLTHRTLLTIRRDPLLMTSRILFHLMIPILMGHVYGKATGAANACPHYEPEIDITQIPSLVEGKRIEFMLEELHMSIENVSMFFIIMYAFAAAVLALNALSFPLNMQVLLKETRNGWYSMSSYVLAKTLADLPLELTMPCLTMALVYPLTGQPSSYLQWRMLTICLIMTLCSLIAQTQALILGALVMNSVQTAVFVSQASQLPWVILAGFTIRIKRLSEPLKLISLTSFYRLGCEAITLTRYGFGICPCNPKEISGEPVKLVGIPDQLRTLAQYWIDSMEANKLANNDTSSTLGSTIDDNDDSIITTTTTTTTTLAPTTISSSKTDIFQHLANQLSYANSYGVNITSCDDVAPDRIRAINLGDNWLVARIWHLFIMLIIMKILLYYAVKFSIGIRL